MGLAHRRSTRMEKNSAALGYDRVSRASIHHSDRLRELPLPDHDGELPTRSDCYGDASASFDLSCSEDAEAAQQLALSGTNMASPNAMEDFCATAETPSLSGTFVLLAAAGLYADWALITGLQNLQNHFPIATLRKCYP